MITLNDINKKKVENFIDENELDLEVFDNTLSGRFSVISDNINFYLYENGNDFIILKHDLSKEKERINNPGVDPYTYFTFKGIQSVLEQLKFYDESLHKVWFVPTRNSIDVPFDRNTYNESWVDEYLADENWRVEKDSLCNYLVYENSSYKPKLCSPFNTLHEVSTINSKTWTEVDKLNFVIYPVSLGKKNEKYFLKLLCNNEDILKEYINYDIFKKKGLKIFLKDLFTTMENFKVN